MFREIAAASGVWQNIQPSEFRRKEFVLATTLPPNHSQEMLDQQSSTQGHLLCNLRDPQTDQALDQC